MGFKGLRVRPDGFGLFFDRFRVLELSCGQGSRREVTLIERGFRA